MSKNLIRKKFVHIAIFALIVIIGYILISDDSETINSKSQSSKSDLDIVEDEFQKLTPEQKSTVVNSYKVAKEMQSQNKFSVALTEIQKIHTLISSYKDSKEIEKKCRGSY